MGVSLPCPLCGASGPYRPVSEDDPLVFIMHHDVGSTRTGARFPVVQCGSCFQYLQHCEQCRRNLVSLTQYGRTCDACIEHGRFPDFENW